jgi:hypothetical protein
MSALTETILSISGAPTLNCRANTNITGTTHTTNLNIINNNNISQIGTETIQYNFIK